MGIRDTLVNGAINTLFRIFCRIDDRELSKIPMTGAALLVSNHTTNWEAPIYYLRLRPRNTIGLGKKELWKFAPTRVIMNTWKAIPLQRGGMDRQAMDACMTALKEDNILCMAPEGRRSPTGCLIRAHAGATFFSTQLHVPIYPMVHWGLTEMGHYMAQLKRTPVHIRVGRPFTMSKKDQSRITSEDRQKMADEMMYQLAILLPPEFRGYYGDLSKMTTEHLTFLEEPK